MEVEIPMAPFDFNFDSACSSPYITAPSSPQRFANFIFSAPTTPTRAAAFYRDFNEFSRYSSADTAVGSEIPFLWEEKPGIPKSNGGGDGDEEEEEGDFEFDFSGQLERNSLSAEELFDGGKIRPLKLKPPPSHYDSVSSNVSSPRSPASSKISQGKKMVQEAFSPRHHRRDFDPFEEALKATRKKEGETDIADRKRGRERTINSIRSSGSRHGISRSLSPLRISDIVFDQDQNPSKSAISSTSSNPKHSISSSSSSFLSTFSFSKGNGNRRWRIRDLLLFRSASEGRATDKKKAVEEMKNSSFRSMESLNSPSSSRRRGSGSGLGSISAHELHYKTNRAVSEELRRKTTLPYKHGLLGCLGFNSSMHRSISRGIGSITRA